jgi:hypothetical protein
MAPDGHSFLEYAFGLAWALAITPIAAGLRGLHGSQWLLLVPTIPVLGFFLGWLTVQYRRMDIRGAQRQAWRTLRQRQSWYKRVRLLAGWLFVETVTVFLILAAVRGDSALLLPLGVGLGAAGAILVGLAWAAGGREMERDGWRW